MASASDYLENAILDHITGNTTYDPPGILYLALFTDLSSLADLELGDISEEVSGLNYQRKSIVFGNSIDGSTANQNTLQFAQAGTGGWGNVKFAAIMDTFTSGNVLFLTQLADTRDVQSGDSFVFNINNYTLTAT